MSAPATQLQVHTPSEIVPLPAKVPGSADNFLALFQHPEAIRRITPLLAPDDAYERIVAVAMRAARKTPALLDCTPTSILDAAATIVGWNLEIGETAHMVPFNDRRNGVVNCTPIMDYKGMAQLLIASRVVRAIESWCVYEKEVERGDFVVTAGSDAHIKHVPHWRGGDRGKMVGAYTIFQLAHNRSTFKLMSLEEIDEIREKHSRSWWKNGRGEVIPCPPWYAKKTTIRQAKKVLGSTPALTRAFAAFEQDQELESGVDPEALGSGEAYGLSLHRTSVDEVRDVAKDEQPAAIAEVAKQIEEETKSMTLDVAKAYVMPIGQKRGEQLANVATSTLRTALMWCWDRKDTGDANDVIAREFAEALGLVLEEREKEVAAPSVGAVQDSPGGSSSTTTLAKDLASPAAVAATPPLAAGESYPNDPYPDVKGTQGSLLPEAQAGVPTIPDLMKHTPSELKTMVTTLLEHPALGMIRADTMTRIGGGMSKTQFASLVIDLTAMVQGATVSARPRNAKGELGVLPGEFDK